MALLKLQDVTLQFAGHPLLDQVNLTIQKRQRIGLLGRNGVGKSTLFKVILGQHQLDAGKIEKMQHLKIADLSQTVDASITGSVFSIVASGLGNIAEKLIQYQNLLENIEGDEQLAQLAKLQGQIDQQDGWQVQTQVETVLSQLKLNGDDEFSSLSGGLKRRVLLAKSLVIKPDLLLLDEPTNHLDIENIEWLEDSLLKFNGSILFITHDRRFLQRLATDILELDRGKLTLFSGSYQRYLQQRDALLLAEENEQQRFKKKLAAEEVWIRQGIKARRTRNEGRVRDLKAMRKQQAQYRKQMGTAQFSQQERKKSGHVVIEVESGSVSYGDRQILQPFDTLILRGDRIGLVGKNGSGKTTLLKLLLKQLAPTSGIVKHGTNLEVAYFDQLKDTLNLEDSVQDNLAGGASEVEINGKKKHVISYLQDFLFTPERIRQPVKALSGGEKSRLLLAKLLLQPANLLVMDEPTNDLDIETLDLLADYLLQYKGTLLLVSHDRDFLDQVVTSLLVIEEGGGISNCLGGYEDWERMQKQNKTPTVKAKTTDKIEDIQITTKVKVVKLSYKEQQELDKLPNKIERLEQQMKEKQSQLADPAIYQNHPEKAKEHAVILADLENQVEQLYVRWEQLQS